MPSWVYPKSMATTTPGADALCPVHVRKQPLNAYCPGLALDKGVLDAPLRARTGAEHPRVGKNQNSLGVVDDPMAEFQSEGVVKKQK